MARIEFDKFAVAGKFVVIERFGSHREEHWYYSVFFGLTNFSIAAYKEGNNINVQYARRCDRENENFPAGNAEAVNLRMYSVAKALADKIATSRNAQVFDRTSVDARRSGSVFTY